jgi:hypothetical protein
MSHGPKSFVVVMKSMIIFGARAKPYNNLTRHGVNRRHESDLLSALFEVALADTYSINPHHPRHIRISKSLQSFEQIGCDVQVPERRIALILDLYPSRVSRIAPAV